MSDSLELVLWSVVCSTLIVGCAHMVARCLGMLFEDLKERRKDRASKWSGEAFHAAEVVDQIERVRGNFIAALADKPQSQRREQVVKARRLVSRRPYFRHLEADAVEQHSH